MDDLISVAESEGFSFVARTVAEWRDGVNRFDRHGESFWVAREHDTIIGVCGLNIDPYAGDPRIGRLRHLYVHPARRRESIATRLANRSIDAAAAFDRVRLRTTNPEASEFYIELGFTVVDEPHATHAIETHS